MRTIILAATAALAMTPASVAAKPSERESQRPEKTLKDEDFRWCEFYGRIDNAEAWYQFCVRDHPMRHAQEKAEPHRQNDRDKR